MKSILTVAAFLFSVAVFAQAGNSPVQFRTIKYSFGNIPQNKPATTQFVFINKGARPLIVANAEAGCGCTTPDYPKAPIMPGDSGVIKVTYNAEVLNTFTKNVNVTFAGIDLPVTLEIDGNVVAPGKKAKQ